MNVIAPYYKAAAAGVVAFCGSLGTALADGNGVSGQEWCAIVPAAVLAVGAVFGIKNAKS